MSWRNLIWMSIILCLAAVVLLVARRNPPQVAPADPVVDELAGAIEAYKSIQQHSYQGLDPDDASRGAIKGMAERVDEFSAHIPPEKVDAVRRRFDGTLTETGLRIAEADGGLVVVGPLPGSPAHEARLFGPLEIAAVNGVEAEYVPLAEARRTLQAGGDEPVALRLRDRQGRPAEVALRPARFDVATVTGLVRVDDRRWLHTLDAEAGIHYLRIAEFVPRTPSEFHDAYRGLGRPRGVVLDLRNNPGGALQPAAEIVDRFLSRGVIVRTVSRQGQEYAHEAHPAGTYPPVRLAVLVDEHTVSAAEIVAGALQVHERAVVVGRPTRGKWCVQRLVDLGYGLGSLYLTTARYVLPQRPTTAPATAPPPATAPAPGEGIRPDVEVRLTVRAARQLERLRLRASVVPAPRRAPPAAGAGRVGPAERLKRDILTLDTQLAEALRLLTEEPAPKPPPGPEDTPTPAEAGQP